MNGRPWSVLRRDMSHAPEAGSESRSALHHGLLMLVSPMLLTVGVVWVALQVV
jgi:hypothetical protein